MVCPSGGWSLDLIPLFPTGREDLRVHPDQPPAPYTLGCIGVDCEVSGDLYNQLLNYFNSDRIFIDVFVYP